MSGRKHRDKGNRAELEIVQLHEDIGIHAERYPLSGASHFRGSGHDLDIYAEADQPPLHAEVKARSTGEGFAQIEKWLGDFDMLILKRNRKKPLVVLPWHVYEWFMGIEDLWQPGNRNQPPDATSPKRGLPGQIDMFPTEKGKAEDGGAPGEAK